MPESTSAQRKSARSELSNSNRMGEAAAAATAEAASSRQQQRPQDRQLERSRLNLYPTDQRKKIIQVYERIVSVSPKP